MSERETQTPGPPIVDEQNVKLEESKAGQCPFSVGAR